MNEYVLEWKKGKRSQYAIVDGLGIGWTDNISYATKMKSAQAHMIKSRLSGSFSLYIAQAPD